MGRRHEIDASSIDRRGLLAGLAGASAALTLHANGAAGTVAPTDPDLASPELGPNVIVFDPAMPAGAIQARLDDLFRQQERAHFTDRRYAVLFKPGRYRADCNIGYFTQVAGLGLTPDAVEIDGHVHVEADFAKGLALNNFWRGAENLAVTPPDGHDRWAASQAAPYRRMRLRGDLALDDGGWASGGFIADCVIEGTVRSGSQQQYLTRSSALGGWANSGSNWNMMFVGVRGAPNDSYPDPMVTVVPQAPRLREKPFLCIDRHGAWQVFVPAWRDAHQGPSWTAGPAPGRGIPLNRFLIARPGMSARTINAALAAGRHLLLTPGVYPVDEPLRVTRRGTIVLGLGLATLMPVRGTAALRVADVAGVAVAGLLVDAGPQHSPLLIEIGPRGARGDHRADPISLHDVFVRIGGGLPGRAGTGLEVNSHGVFGDHLWIWRADHGNLDGGPVHVGWTENPAMLGLVVNGDDVTMCGLFVEHFAQFQTVWNGDGGRTLFYQSELPYDPPNQAAFDDGATRGYASYRVADDVTRHHATGMGVYCYFTADPGIVTESAVIVPRRPGVVVERVTTVSLGGGKGSIAHLVNDAGPAARPGAIRQTLRRYSG